MSNFGINYTINPHRVGKKYARRDATGRVSVGTYRGERLSRQGFRVYQLQYAFNVEVEVKEVELSQTEMPHSLRLSSNHNLLLYYHDDIFTCVNSNTL
ncbi:hypothetical protein BDZ89DRAFT_482645 [Hymenopellis radicata]|nr:hypothetical protein BDZ89DRAFT_482645 [Hymenopellis radicata]